MRAEAVSNRGPSTYQPNASPVGQTGSRTWRAQRASFNTLDNEGHKTPHQSNKRKDDRRKKEKEKKKKKKRKKKRRKNTRG